MNCKQGDLAIIVKSKNNPKFVGSILRVIDCHETRFGTAWKICDNANLVNSGYLNILDECVMPIRDSDKEDEMLSIVKIKEKVNA